MLRILKFFNFIVVKLLEYIFRPFGVRRRAVFVSYFSKDPEGNLRCIMDVMEENGDMPVVKLFSAYGKGIGAKIAFIGHSIKEVYYYSTSSLILLEGNSYVLSVIKKKKSVTAIQVWHAAGAFKKFGADVDRLYEIKGLDYAFVSCPAVCGIYSGALGIERKNVIPIGIPRADVLANADFTRNARGYIDHKYPSLKGKKLALYAPTFRGKGIDDINEKPVDVLKLTEGLDGWTVALRTHPLMAVGECGVVDLRDEDLMITLAAADLLITDYSSIIFEYSLLDRPMLFLAPDIGDYAEERGFYFGYSGFVPGRICRTETEVRDAISRRDFCIEKRRDFCGRFTYGFDGSATERAVELCMELIGKKAE